jgi:TrmH family RNA methyltransferase
MLSKNRIKYIKSLQIKKNRDLEGFFIAEGEKIVSEIANSKSSIIESWFYTKEFDISEIDLEKGILIDDKELQQISSLKTANKALAICKKAKNELQKSEFYLALDEIQDPGNLGTIIRLADWFGISNIFCSQNTVDCYNPKVIQASMASFLRVNVFYGDLKEFLTHNKLPSYGAFLEGKSIYSEKVSPKGILVIGNEGNGISAEIEKLITDKITIPKIGKAESLNASIATSILLSEFFRNSF